MLLVYCTWLKLLREIICAETLEFCYLQRPSNILLFINYLSSLLFLPSFLGVRQSWNQASQVTFHPSSFHENVYLHVEVIGCMF